MTSMINAAKKLGSRGGKKTLELYGKKHFQELRQKGVDKKKKEKEAQQNKTIDERS